MGHPLFAIAPAILPLVFKFYDSLSGFSCPPSHVMSNARASRKFPQLDKRTKYVKASFISTNKYSRLVEYDGSVLAYETKGGWDGARDGYLGLCGCMGGWVVCIVCAGMCVVLFVLRLLVSGPSTVCVHRMNMNTVCVR